MTGNGKKKNHPPKPNPSKNTYFQAESSVQDEMYLSVIFYELTAAKERLHHLEGFPAVPSWQVPQ